MRARAVVLELLTAAIVLGGCTTGTASTTPRPTVAAWFRAINAKDGTAQTFVSAPFKAAWSRPATWPRFSDLRCRTQAQTTSSATIRCNFSESPAIDAGNPDGFWDIQTTLQRSGQWLITNYGEG